MQLQNLWIMRHGLAENEFDTDFNRALSSTGICQSENVARQLANDELKPTHMVVSPFRRTQETAEVVHRVLQLERSFETDEMLVHFADHQILGDYLMTVQISDLIIVSHMPIVAKLCQYLVPRCDIYGFDTAQIVRISFDNKMQGSIKKIYHAKE